MIDVETMDDIKIKASACRLLAYELSELAYAFPEFENELSEFVKMAEQADMVEDIVDTVLMDEWLP